MKHLRIICAVIFFTTNILYLSESSEQKIMTTEENQMLGSFLLGVLRTNFINSSENWNFFKQLANPTRTYVSSDLAGTIFQRLDPEVKKIVKDFVQYYQDKERLACEVEWQKKENAIIAKAQEVFKERQNKEREVYEASLREKERVIIAKAQETFKIEWDKYRMAYEDKLKKEQETIFAEQQKKHQDEIQALKASHEQTLWLESEIASEIEDYSGIYDSMEDIFADL
jgi:hypothetical protein